MLIVHKGLPSVFSPAKRAFPRDVNHSRMGVGSVTRWWTNACSLAGKVSFLHDTIVVRVGWTWTSGCVWGACYLIFCLADNWHWLELSPYSLLLYHQIDGSWGKCKRAAGWFRHHANKGQMFLCSAESMIHRNRWWVPVLHLFRTSGVHFHGEYMLSMMIDQGFHSSVIFVACTNN